MTEILGHHPTAAQSRWRSLLGLAALLPLFLLTACGVNAIPTYEEQAKAAWSQVLNQYQRRADLVPNLVETVKGYAAHESETLQAIVEARSKVTQTQIPADILTNPDAFKTFQDNQAALTGALSRLLVVVEQYPDLKANQNFLQLQAELSDLENKIAAARRFFNNAAAEYNASRESFPAVVFAQSMGFGPQDFFNLEEGERAAVQRVPEVKF
jgi:LemA protein